MNSFSQTINYIASAIDMIGKNTTSTTRQISGYNMRRGNSNQGRGRGGRGNHNGRGGRGRNNNNSNNGTQSDQGTTAGSNRPINRAYR
jgi:hypothetical protein